jgi:hypothetical protein
VRLVPNDNREISAFTGLRHFRLRSTRLISTRAESDYAEGVKDKEDALMQALPRPWRSYPGLRCRLKSQGKRVSSLTVRDILAYGEASKARGGPGRRR